MWWPVTTSTIKTMSKTAIEPTRMGTTRQEAAIWDEATSNDEMDTTSDCGLPRDVAKTGLQAHEGAAQHSGSAHEQNARGRQGWWRNECVSDQARTFSTRQTQLIRVAQLALQAELEALEALVRYDLLSSRQSNLTQRSGVSILWGNWDANAQERGETGERGEGRLGTLTRDLKHFEGQLLCPT